MQRVSEPNRDFCYLECQKEFTDARGRRGWVRSLHSLKLPCCPSLEKDHGVVRASIYRSGLTAVETDEPGVLSVTYTVELDLKGHMALELLQPGFLAQRVAALASVDKLLQQQRLSTSPLLGDLDIPHKKRVRGSCNLCFREFSHISAHTTRATYPIRRKKEPETEVEGITHPGLLDPPARRRSLSMLDRPSDAASFFAQQEEIKRDLELRATELSHRVQLWDEMQMYEQEYSTAPSEQEQEQEQQQQQQQQQQQHAQREQRDYESHQNRTPPSLEPEEEPEEKAQHRQAAGSESASESEGRHRDSRYPSFLSSELSSQEPSDAEREELNRLTAEAGARLSTDYRDSDLSDYEEHTIDDVGEVRTTTDLTRWWQDQQRLSEAGEQPTALPQAQTNLSPVQSPRKARRRVSSEEREKTPRAKNQATSQQHASVVAAATSGRNSKQEMVDLYHHWKQESTNEHQHQRHHHSLDLQNQLQEFEEQAQYQEEQERRRHQSIAPPISEPKAVKQPSNLSVLHQIQQRQKELEQLRRHRQQPHDADPPVSRMQDQQNNQRAESNVQSTLAAKERHLQQQRQQQLDLAAQREREARLQANTALDQTAGEDVELMESSQGEWIPISEARAKAATAKTELPSVEDSPTRGPVATPGFCAHCGSPEYMDDNGVVKLSCMCESKERLSTANKAAGTVLFDGKWISSPSPQEA
ncbi:hypothetical protein G195_010519 [Phytophthora kernoviae 00238/432]|uniref:START domain-containing protein n=1 Tax=Phytophthora kernoviae 00238/432 TaxID=1284355 RepID=A0A8J4RT53_9STRA|nr:hypothetical protein G195_010519 [Phytophthora kernoviae 00238/432]